jgi:hypothetical protein
MGKPKHSDDHRGEQKGAVERDVTQHGDKSYEARKAEISDHGQQRGGAAGRSERAASDPRADGSDADDHERLIANPGANSDGGHRLFENRTQHDDAEKNSEKNRRDIDVRRHDHDAQEFQNRGGHAGSVHHHDDPANIKSTGHGGGNRSDADRGGH